jgi:hypothetical protein
MNVGDVFWVEFPDRGGLAWASALRGDRGFRRRRRQP